LNALAGDDQQPAIDSLQKLVIDDN